MISSTPRFKRRAKRLHTEEDKEDLDDNYIRAQHETTMVTSINRSAATDSVKGATEKIERLSTGASQNENKLISEPKKGLAYPWLKSVSIEKNVSLEELVCNARNELFTEFKVPATNELLIELEPFFSSLQQQRRRFGTNAEMYDQLNTLFKRFATEKEQRIDKLQFQGFLRVVFVQRLGLQFNTTLANALFQLLKKDEEESVWLKQVVWHQEQVVNGVRKSQKYHFVQQLLDDWSQQRKLIEQFEDDLSLKDEQLDSKINSFFSSLQTHQAWYSLLARRQKSLLRAILTCALKERRQLDKDQSDLENGLGQDFVSLVDVLGLKPTLQLILTLSPRVFRQSHVHKELTPI